MLWKLRSADNSEEEVRAMIDEYFNNVPAALTRAYESQLAEKDEEIAPFARHFSNTRWMRTARMEHRSL